MKRTRIWLGATGIKLRQPNGKRLFLTAAAVLLFALRLSAQSANAIVGTWLNEEKEGKIEIFEHNGKYSGKIVWLKEPNENGKPKADALNPDPTRRNQPIMGLVLMRNLTFDGKNKWEDGEIYDARSGKTYKCRLTLSGENTLHVRGFMGYAWMGLGRTTTWTRTN